MIYEEGTDDGADEEVAPEGAKPVPYDTFLHTRRQLKAANARIKALEGEVTGYKAQIEEWTGKGKEWESTKSALEAEKLARAEDRAFAAAGIVDPEVQDLVRYAYGRLPADGRKPIAEVIDAWKAKPDEAPVAVRPHLAPPAKQAANGAPPPKVNGSTTTRSTTGGGMTAAELMGRAMADPAWYAEARKSGEYQRLLDASR